jgi:flagellar hook-associated protein 3 FlgL
MRITEGYITDKFLFNNNKIAARKVKLQTQLATNSKIDTLSDDLAPALESIKIKSQVKKNENYAKNIEKGKEFMNASLQSLDSIAGEIQKIMVQTVNADNPLNLQNLNTIAQSVKNSLGAIAQNMNSTHNEMNIFGGTNYTSSPISIDVNGKAVVSAADFSGEVKVQISQNSQTAINIPGSKIINTGLFDTINNIIDSLAAGSVPSKTDTANLQTAYNEVLGIQSIGGEAVNRMDSIDSLLENQRTNLKEVLAKNQEVDVAALVTELQNQDYLLQMSYKLLANSYPQSVFDYL